MQRNKISVALDAALPHLGLYQGHQVQFNDGLPTIDDGLAFYISQLTAVEARIYDVKYRNIVYQNYVPVDTNIPEWADSFTYFSYDAVTAGKFIGASAKDLPEADINPGIHMAKVYYGGNAYHYNLDELRKSQQMNMPLDTLRAAASFRGFQEHAQRVAFFGDASRGLYGLLNNPNVQTVAGAIDWATATGQEKVFAINAILQQIWTNSAQTHVPNVLLLPPSIWINLNSTRMDTGTDTTVLQFLQNNNMSTAITGQPLVIGQLLELETAGAGGTRRIVAYELNDENLTMKMPFAWRSVAPQPEGLTVRVPAEYKFGGVEIRYPGAFAYRDLAA